MTFYKGPPKPKFKTGPSCGGCPFRQTSFGFAPPSIPEGVIDENNNINTQYLFLLEALGYDEVEQGRNAVGGTGKTFNRLLQSNTKISRSHQTVANTVCCRPVVWTTDNNGNQIPLIQDNGDMVNAKPSKAQIRECASRYTDDLISRFNGKYIITLGKIPSEYMTEKTIAITNMRGSIWEPGFLIDCPECKEGKNEKVKQIKCKHCKGKGQVSKGRGKAKETHSCVECQATGVVEKITFKNCDACGGDGKVSSDPDKPNVCNKLKPKQLLFMTFHPAALMHNPNYFSVVNRDFARMENIEAELKIEDVTKYETYPLPESIEVKKLLEYARDGWPVSIDIETTGSLDPTEGDIYCVGATVKPTRGFAFTPEDPIVQELLKSETIIGQNFVLYDQWWFKHKGYEIQNTTRIYDTRYLGKLLNPDTPNDLVYLTGEFADPPIRGYWKTKQEYAKNKEGISCIDVDATLRVFHGQMEKIAANGQTKIVEDYIVPMSKVVFDMRWAGMKIDKEKMDETRELILRDLESKRLSLPWSRQDGSIGTENQSGEVQRYLYESNKLPVINNRKTGKPTGNGEALEELRSRLEIHHRSVRHIQDDDAERIIECIKNIEECRDLSKLEGNFLRYKLNDQDYVHPALNMGGSSRGKHDSGRGTASWRFSCSDPNAQQVPKRARNIFIPDYPDWEIASIDLRQAEVIGFLWYAEEWKILDDVLRKGMDAHRRLASDIVGRDCTDEERDEYKNTTFALLYGESPRSTAMRLHKSIDEIKAARDYYFRMLPGTLQYRHDTIERGRAVGYVESPFGFRRYVYIESEHGRAANQACNAPIQNIPPIVTGRAMIGLHSELPKPARLWMQSHDEILLTYPKNMRQSVIECAIDWLRRPVPELPAPVLNMAGGLIFNIDIEIGDNWRDLVKVTKEFGV